MSNRLTNPFHFVPDDNGEPVPFGLLYSYRAGSLDPLPTFADEDGTANPNPAPMDAAGKATVVLDGNYRLIFRDADGNQIYDIDDVSSTELEEWVNCRDATFVSATVVTVGGDQTANYQVNRGVKINNNPVEVFSIVESASYSAGTDLTTITIVDSVITSGVVNICASIVGPDSGITAALISSLAASTGGGLIGVTGGGTLQAKIDEIEADIDALDYQPYSATLNVPVGGRRTGSDGELYRALIANGPDTAVVDPVGDVSGTWTLDSPEVVQVPVGTYLLGAWSAPPVTSGTTFLVPDGSAFVPATYPELAVLFPGGVLPDWRGEFPRVWSNGRSGVDVGRAINTSQGESVIAHSHTVSNFGALETGSGSFTQGSGSGQPQLATDSFGGSETRPRNVSSNIIIRAA